MKLLKKTQQAAPARRRNSEVRSKATSDDLSDRYAFRRNRTLTGSLSARVASATEQRAELKSSRVQAHDLRRHRRRLSVILVGVLVIGLGLFYLVYQSVAAVRVVTTTGRDVTARYSDTIQQYLGGRPAERFRFSLDTQRLAQYLQVNGFPEVAGIAKQTSFAGFATTQISIEPRRPVVSWLSNSTERFVDDEGNAFSYNYYSQPSVQVVDKSGIEATNSQVLASNRFLGFIGQVVGGMKYQGLVVSEVSLPVGTARQVQVLVQDVGYPIKFSVDRSAGEQSEDAARAIRHLARQGVTPAYLDVRVSGRAYYQ